MPTFPRPRILTAIAAATALALAGCSDGSDDPAPGTADAAAPRAPNGQGAALAAPVGPDGASPAAGITVEGAGRISGRPDTLTATLSPTRPSAATWCPTCWR